MPAKLSLERVLWKKGLLFLKDSTHDDMIIRPKIIIW